MDANTKEVHSKPRLHAAWSMTAMLHDPVVVVVVRTRPRAIPLAMITMRKSTHGFSFVSHIWAAYGAPLLKRIREKVSVVSRCLVNKPVVKSFARICTYRNYMQV